MEVYFVILDSKNVVELCRFRASNHKLPIEIRRWNNTNRNNRICTHYTKNELGDACHYILDSSFFEQDRNIYIPKYYYSRPIIFLLVLFHLLISIGNLWFDALNLHNSTTFLLSKITKYTSMPKHSLNKICNL
jgi:hypothetical protein